MKVTRDKTSVDLGNGVRLTYSDSMGYWLHFMSKDGRESGEKLDFANDWANEIMDKNFTPVHITLETEDEACTLWHYLERKSDYLLAGRGTMRVEPSKWMDSDMFNMLNDVYSPKKKNK